MLEINKVTWLTGKKSEMKRLYLSAFPEEERISFFALQLLTTKPNVELLSFYECGQFVGFAFLLSDKSITFLWYLAVKPELRSMGYGNEILNILKKRYQNQKLVLDIEVVTKQADNYLQRKRRRNFYLKNEFLSLNLGLEIYGATYEILACGNRVTQEECIKFFEMLGFEGRKRKIIKLNEEINDL